MSYHQPVLAQEVVDAFLKIPPGYLIDGTLGGGGHSRLLVENLSEEFSVVSFDRDADAIAHVAKNFPELNTIHAPFSTMKFECSNRGIQPVVGVLLDLGVSSYQLDTAERGFSFMRSGPLDMRMDNANGATALEFLEAVDELGLTTVLGKYGDVQRPRGVARKILRAVAEQMLHTTEDLANLFPKRYGDKIHPATKIFQAIRIEVNGEMEHLEKLLDDMPEILSQGGRVGIISFHSLEDRIVKHRFKQWQFPCTCPSGLPECQCGKEPLFERVTRKPITAQPEELEHNPRARSAKLRIAERL
jgi:16S rRNA (cytosine1402-N4)-methyltransferase